MSYTLDDVMRMFTTGEVPALPRHLHVGGEENDVFHIEDSISAIWFSPRQSDVGEAWGNGGDDAFHVYSGKNNLFGGIGSDIFYLFGGINVVDAGVGNDQVISTGGRNFIFGGDGNDTLILSIGDHAQGGAGSDTFSIRGDRNGEIHITDFNFYEGDVLDLSALGVSAYDMYDDGQGNLVISSDSAYGGAVHLTLVGISEGLGNVFLASELGWLIC